MSVKSPMFEIEGGEAVEGESFYTSPEFCEARRRYRLNGSELRASSRLEIRILCGLCEHYLALPQARIATSASVQLLGVRTQPRSCCIGKLVR